MQLLLAVVDPFDAEQVATRLNRIGIRLTRMESAGVFLGSANATLLIGVDDAVVPQVIAVLAETCRTRQAFVNPSLWALEQMRLAMTAPAPIEAEVGGATVFAIPVKRFLRIGGGAVIENESPELARGEGQTDLVLAIVRSEDADAVQQALLRGGYRLTRISTAGGFLRRGNATLLIGVEEGQVDDVVSVIRDNCQSNREARPPETGMPMYAATIFVLQTSQVVRV